MAEKKYIDADIVATALRTATKSISKRADFWSVIDNAPAADVVEVKHGKWIDNSYYKMDAKGNEIICADRDYVCCSECKFSFNKLVDCVEEFLCCPYCGARMDGKEMKTRD